MAKKSSSDLTSHTNKQNPNISYFKIFLIAIAFFGILVLSELIYLYYNRPQILSGVFLYKVQSLSNQKAGSEKIKKYLSIAAKIQLSYNSRKYKSLIPEWNPDTPITEGSEYEKAFYDYISGLDLKEVRDGKEHEISRIFYDLGVRSYKIQEPDSFLPFIQTAVYLSPELSHYHVELANFYLHQGNAQKAQEALDYCLKFLSPVQHCQDYQNNAMNTNLPEDPGFLEAEVFKYYQIGTPF